MGKIYHNHPHVHRHLNVICPRDTDKTRVRLVDDIPLMPERELVSIFFYAEAKHRSLVTYFASFPSGSQ